MNLSETHIEAIWDTFVQKTRSPKTILCELIREL